MTTDLGKELRKIRIDHEERLLDMAQRLDKSASFISAIEVGKKSPPSSFVEAIIKAYNLVGQAADAVIRAADRSRAAFMITPSSALGRDTAALMARKIDTLSEEQLKSIQAILNTSNRRVGK